MGNRSTGTWLCGLDFGVVWCRILLDSELLLTIELHSVQGVRLPQPITVICIIDTTFYTFFLVSEQHRESLAFKILARLG